MKDEKVYNLPASKMMRIPFSKNDRIYRIPEEDYDLIVRDVPQDISDDFMFAVIGNMERDIRASTFGYIQEQAISLIRK